MTDDDATHPGRRRFLAGVTAAAGVAGTMTAVSAADTHRLKMQSAWPLDSVQSALAEDYIQRVEDLSGGSLRIEYLGRNAIVGNRHITAAVSEGAVDAGYSLAQHWAQDDPAALLFGAGPVLGCDSRMMLAWMEHGGGNELYGELLQRSKLDVVTLFCAMGPPRPFGWFDTALKDAKDLSGVEFQATGIAARILKRMGVNAVDLPVEELIANFHTGRIQGFDSDGPSADLQRDAAALSKNLHLGSFLHATELVQVSFNATTFKRLSRQHQAVLHNAAAAVSTAGYGTQMHRQSADLQVLLEQQQVNAYRTAPSILVDMLEAWDQMLAEYSDADPLFSEILGSQKTWCERVGYYEHMNAPDYRLAYQHYFPNKLPD